MSEVVSGRSYLKLKIQTAGLIKIRTTRFHGYVADSPRLDVMLLSRLVLTKMGRNVGNPIFFRIPAPDFLLGSSQTRGSCLVYQKFKKMKFV